MMQNLVLNQHGVYTFRYYTHGKSIRVSLGTKSLLDAKHTYYRVQQALVGHSRLSYIETKLLILTAIEETQNLDLVSNRLKLIQSLSESLGNQDDLTLTDVFEKFVKEKLRSGSWRQASEVLARNNFSQLVELLDDLPIRTVSDQHALFVKESLQQLPKHSKKKRKYKLLSVTELLKIDVPPTDLMSVKTINMKLTIYAEIWSWASNNGLADTNPFKGIQIRDRRRAQSLREPFSIEDLNKIFSSHHILGAKLPYRFWVPLLALYTGARINELCQLYVSDIGAVDELWCIHITDERDDQMLKNVSSRRTIPLHRDLIDFGFAAYLAEQQALGHSRLFPELKIWRNKYSREASKWFSRIKPKVLPKAGSKKCFHSFRHNFADNLMHENGWGADLAVKALLGHHDADITSGLYGSGVTSKRLHEVIQSQNWKDKGVEIRLPSTLRNRLS